MQSILEKTYGTTYYFCEKRNNDEEHMAEDFCAKINGDF